MGRELKTTSPQKPRRAPETDPGLGHLLTSIFEDWRRAGVVFLILRNYEQLPAATTNDVDVLVSPEQLAQAESSMIASAARAGYRLHNRVEFATVSYFFHHPGSLRQIQIDLFFQLKWHTFELIPTAAVLNERVERKLFATPHPVHEAALNLLSRLIYNGLVKEKYRPAIRAGFKQYPDRARAILSDCFGSRLGSEVVRLSVAEQWREVERLWRPLQRALMIRRLSRQPLRTSAGLVRDFVRLLGRIAHPGGVTLVLLGPDGSGKSTVGAKLVDNLRNTFNPGKGLLIHWKPVVFFSHRRQPKSAPNINPHGGDPRGRLASLAYLGGHWLEFFLGSHLQFRKALFKNGLVLIDRYHYDFLVDQRRYRLRVPHWLVRLLFTTVKRPDLVFLLDASAEVFQARKQEVPLEETARQSAAYRHLIHALPQGVRLDATRPATEVADNLTAQVLAWMHERLRRRRIINPDPHGMA